MCKTEDRFFCHIDDNCLKLKVDSNEFNEKTNKETSNSIAHLAVLSTLELNFTLRTIKQMDLREKNYLLIAEMLHGKLKKCILGICCWCGLHSAQCRELLLIVLFVRVSILIVH